MIAYVEKKQEQLLQFIILCFSEMFLDLLWRNEQPHFYFKYFQSSEEIEVTDKIFTQPIYDTDGKFIPFQV